MRYLIGLLVLLFVVALVFKVPVFRAAAWVIAGGIVLLAGALFVTQQSEHAPAPTGPSPEELQQARIEADAALWRVLPVASVGASGESLKLDDPKEENAPMEYAATVRNSGDRTVDKIAVRIRLYDCPGKPPPNFSGCLTIDDDLQNIAVQLAPKESRTISAKFHFHHPRKTTGTFAWRPEITRVHVVAQATAP